MTIERIGYGAYTCASSDVRESGGQSHNCQRQGRRVANEREVHVSVGHLKPTRSSLMGPFK